MIKGSLIFLVVGILLSEAVTLMVADWYSLSLACPDRLTMSATAACCTSYPGDTQQTMPANARVTLCHGPYESCGEVQHRTFRLQGLQAALRARGHQCVLEETREWNIVELVVSGKVVFRCNLKDLEFGGDGKLDPLCKEAVAAVDNAY